MKTEGKAIDEATAVAAVNELTLYEVLILGSMMESQKRNKEAKKIPVIVSGIHAIGVDGLVKRGYLEWHPSIMEVFWTNRKLSSVKQYRLTPKGMEIAPYWFKYRQTKADKS